MGVLILAHEWGHFIIAKRSGLTVEEFGFGFPPRIFSINEAKPYTPSIFCPWEVLLKSWARTELGSKILKVSHQSRLAFAV